MFERVRFMLGFAGAYRRSRRDGAGHEAALEAASEDLLGRQHTGAVPAAAAELWSDPDPECALADGGWFGDGTLEITEEHLTLLRQARLSWDSAERGAPMLDPRRPYGREDLLGQLSEVFGGGDIRSLARRHVEMYFVMTRALRHGALAPGRYPLGNVAAAQVRTTMHGYQASDEDLGLDADGLVTVTDDHLELLRAIEIRWPSGYDCQDRLVVGEYPAATADPKRPYGDYTFIEVDMARILGELPPGDGAAIFEPDPDLARRLQRLHWQMFVVMQVFLERMALAPGRYGR